MRLGRATLAVLAAALALGACGSGSTGSVKLVETGTVPDPMGTGAAVGAESILATYEVTGPTKNGVVVCKFTGKHTSNAGQTQAPGWISYTRVTDLKEGESTRGTCQAIAFPPLGDEAPSQPVLSITAIEKMEPAPADWQTEYVPPTPWP